MCYRNAQAVCRLQGIQAVTSGGDDLPSGKHYCQASAYAFKRGKTRISNYNDTFLEASIAVVSEQSLPFWQCSKPSLLVRLDNEVHFFGSNCTAETNFQVFAPKTTNLRQFISFLPCRCFQRWVRWSRAGRPSNPETP